MRPRGPRESVLGVLARLCQYICRQCVTRVGSRVLTEMSKLGLFLNRGHSGAPRAGKSGSTRQLLRTSPDYSVEGLRRIGLSSNPHLQGNWPLRYWLPAPAPVIKGWRAWSHTEQIDKSTHRQVVQYFTLGHCSKHGSLQNGRA